MIETMKEVKLSEWRCSGCRRILAKMTTPSEIRIEIKCKCNTVNSLNVLQVKDDSVN